MLPVVIGSVALSYQLDKLGITHNIEALDLDIICTQSTSKDLLKSFDDHDVFSDKIIEKFKVNSVTLVKDGKYVEIVYPVDDCSTQTIIEKSREWTDYIHLHGVKFIVPPIELLYSLKCSHKFLRNSPHFLKTMVTINNLRKIGVQHADMPGDWFDRRVKETYDYSHPILSVSKNEFFTSNFEYVYDHDSIHESVKLLDNPAYTYYMSGDHEVQCSQSKFESLSIEFRMLGVLEEVYVLALERSQIPNQFKIDRKLSFMLALEKVCTSITSGWFRDFAWDNYAILEKLYDDSYVDKFLSSKENGIIKPYKGNV